AVAAMPYATRGYVRFPTRWPSRSSTRGASSVPSELPGFLRPCARKKRYAAILNRSCTLPRRPAYCSCLASRLQPGSAAPEGRPLPDERLIRSHDDSVDAWIGIVIALPCSAHCHDDRLALLARGCDNPVRCRARFEPC